jgi:cellulose synthase/poly-beta-1,6-N-acetylglucosamine synthase-like glycosyltransferase
MLAPVVVVAAAPLVIAIYAYAIYPCVLWIVGRLISPARAWPGANEWPTVTMTVPVYNAAAKIRATLTHLLEVDYPRELIQLLVLSDASDDGTDDIVREFAAQGVELLRAPARQGKTAAENAAVAVARGEIIVNVDATIVVPKHSLKPLVRAFDDPTVGVASGRDVSIGAGERDATGAESGYIGYEMWVRDLETKIGSIVGASGCFYGIRRQIRTTPLPPELSWDFASTLVARQQGFRSVSVPAAVCFVPRASDVRGELTRKSRTMARGLSTLFRFAALMNPLKYGSFAIMLVSHKLFRWLPFLLAPSALVALGWLAATSVAAAILFGVITVGITVGAATIRRNGLATVRPLALASFVVAAVAAGFLAWVDALRGARLATWDPTRRPSISAS